MYPKKVPNTIGEKKYKIKKKRLLLGTKIHKKGKRRKKRGKRREEIEIPSQNYFFRSHLCKIGHVTKFGHRIQEFSSHTH